MSHTTEQGKMRSMDIAGQLVLIEQQLKRMTQFCTTPGQGTAEMQMEAVRLLELAQQANWIAYEDWNRAGKPPLSKLR